MSPEVLWHRIQFAFTITYHYLFPQLTMGLALLIVVLKLLAVWNGDERYNEVVRFWARIFGLNFAMGVVTGIPMEFQFGTNWARFSTFAGGVVGQTLAMEGVFAFILESSFVGLFLFGEKRLGPRGHLATAVALFLGSWLSGYFIIATNAFMQHPVGYTLGADGVLHLADFWSFVLNPWAFWQYAHNMTASVITASFVVAAVGALLDSDGQTYRACADLPAGWRDRRVCIVCRHPLSHRRWRGQTGLQPPAGRRWRRWKGSSTAGRMRNWRSSASRTSNTASSRTRSSYRACSASWPTEASAARLRD